ncbi:MAG: type IV secretory system conjugative DNA transfer family protein, partial [Chloroflexi bacterium]|nr:type IV secretory system conjugative DNA transfer family protein [Chloroflexota bacterium]
SDDFLVEWWRREFKGWRNEYRADALAPVQTRLSYYASSQRARAILGQSRSTFDLRRTILDGGVLLVSTAQGAAGRDVAALIGSSVLNLVDAVIREQGALPPEQRRGALVVVDEMQSMPGVDYESMLSELGKFGASLVLATQSLAKLDDLSPTMRDTLLANIGCLAVFQVAGSDARQLVWELDRDRVSEEDVVSLPAHQAYVRATVGTERMPAFSMEVLKPEGGSPETAAHIRDEASAYLLSEEEIAAQRAEGRRRVDLWLEQMAEEDGKQAGASGEGERDQPDDGSKRNRRRGRRRGEGGTTGEDGA